MARSLAAGGDMHAIGMECHDALHQLAGTILYMPNVMWRGRVQTQFLSVMMLLSSRAHLCNAHVIMSE